MTPLDTILRRRETIASGTMAFHFDKPAGFQFKAGQAMDLLIPARPAADSASGRHTFSIVSAPFENDLVIATRMRDSEFKNTLKAMSIGSSARIEGPFGSLVLHKDLARAAVFVAGGIGITPFMSMLRQAAKDDRPQRLVLLYSNRREEDAAFLAELQQLGREHTNISLVATLTQAESATGAWSGLRGPIDEALVRRTSAELPSPIYYLAGPPAMVAALRQTLELTGIDSDDVRSEDFYGY